MTDAEAKVCYTCNHYPNNEHCIGCVWDKEKGNTKWKLGRIRNETFNSNKGKGGITMEDKKINGIQVISRINGNNENIPWIVSQDGKLYMIQVIPSGNLVKGQPTKCTMACYVEIGEAIKEYLYGTKEGK